MEPAQNEFEWVRKLTRYKVDDPYLDILTEYADYKGEPVEDVVTRCETAQATPPDIHNSELYEDSEEFLFALLAGNARVRHLTARTAVALQNAKNLRGVRYLDVGAGIGRDCLAHALVGFEVTHADVPGIQTDFAAWRYHTRGQKIRIVDARSLPEERFDAISCYDVAEHVEDLPGLLVDLSCHLETGGQLYLAVDLYNPGPFHRPESAYYGFLYKELLEVSGMQLIQGPERSVIAATTADWCIYQKTASCQSSPSEERRNLARRVSDHALADLHRQRDILSSTIDYLEKVSFISSKSA